MRDKRGGSRIKREEVQELMNDGAVLGTRGVESSPYESGVNEAIFEIRKQLGEGHECRIIVGEVGQVG